MQRATQESGGAPAVEKKIVEITQEGIGRISKADNPKGIEGLYTDGLQTCVAIALVSAKGISLIHATIALKVERLIAEVKWHGKVTRAKFIYNPDPLRGYPEGAENTKFKTFMDEYDDVYQLLCHMGALSASSYHAASAQCNALVEINGEIHTDIARKPEGLISPPHRQLRHDIQYVNSCFMPFAAKKDPDFQFNGRQFTPIPPLSKSFDEIEALLRAEENRFMSDDVVPGTKIRRIELTRRALKSYMSCMKRLTIIAQIAARATAAAANTHDPRLLAALPSGFKIGNHCRVTGLMKAPQLNNLTGVIVKWRPEDGRVKFKLDNPPEGSKDHLNIKPANLAVIQVASPDAFPCL